DLNSGIAKKNNFISISDIESDFVRAGYNTEIIIEELNLLYSAGLIFTNDFISDVENEIKLDSSNQIGITQSGVYYLKSLLNKSFYYDLVLQDTPIYNEKCFDELSTNFTECDSYGNRDLAKRKKVSEIFIQYLL